MSHFKFDPFSFTICGDFQITFTVSDWQPMFLIIFNGQIDVAIIYEPVGDFNPTDQTSVLSRIDEVWKQTFKNFLWNNQGYE